MTDIPQTKNRSQLLLIFAIAFASLAGAYLLFYVTQSSAPWATTNNGEFVVPPVHVADLALTRGDGSAVADPPGWWLWVKVDAGCGPDCETALHQLRQLHVLLNKEAPRVHRALVTPPGLSAPGPLDSYPQMQHLITPAANLSQGIYIVDPIGNLVLHYPLTDAGKPVLDDLKRLLRLSQIG